MQSEYTQALQKYTKLRDSSIKRPAFQLQYNHKIFACMLHLNQFDQAAVHCLEVAKTIYNSDNKLLMFSIPKYLMYAAVCYLLTDQFDYAYLCIHHELMPTDYVKRFNHIELILSSLDKDELLLKRRLQAKFGQTLPTLTEPNSAQTLPITIL